MDSNQLIIISIILAAAIIIAAVIFRSGSKKSQIDSSNIPNILSSVTDQLVTLASEKLETQNREIRTDMHSKKEAIENLVKNLAQEIYENNRRLEKAERDRIGSFNSLQREIESHRKITEQLSATTEGLKKVLSNNQLRGQFGEQVAEDLLKMSGFVKGIDYEFNKNQSGSQTRPDFTISLPDKTKINIDAKFPYSNLQKLLESEDKNSKQEYFKKFEQDIKDKIKQVTTRDYINPDDRTVDFVILFIPNEMIFSFIYDKLNDTWADAMNKKVIMAGPFSFTAILRMIRQSYDNFKYQENAHRIISLIKNFESEFEKYNAEFIKIGERINQLSSQYEKVDGTRTRQLMKTIDRIRIGSGTDLPVRQAEI